MYCLLFHVGLWQHDTALVQLDSVLQVKQDYRILYQQITRQQPYTFRHVDKVNMTCWVSPVQPCVGFLLTKENEFLLAVVLWVRTLL